jgi:hypothetical protein
MAVYRDCLFWIPAFAGMTVWDCLFWIPAFAGMTIMTVYRGCLFWIPACAGMTYMLGNDGLQGLFILDSCFRGNDDYGGLQGLFILDSRLRGNDVHAREWRSTGTVYSGFPPSRE